MTKFNISDNPNQSFNVTLNGENFVIVLQTFRGFIYASIYRGSTTISLSKRVVSNTSIFNERVNKIIGGTLSVACNVSDVPTCEMFGNSDAEFVFTPYN